MTYLTRKSYRTETQVLYNATNANSLYGKILTDSVASIGGDKKIIEGSILTNKGLLKRAKLIENYTAAGATIKVNNPYVFAVGDVLYQIGTSTEDASSEFATITGTPQALGTITAINGGSYSQKTEITPSGVAVADVFTLMIEETTVSFVATTTSVADVTAGLKKTLTQGLQSHHSTIEGLIVEDLGTKLVLTAKEPNEIFTVSGSVTGSGAIAIALTQAVGAITIAPASGNTNQTIGAKIGTIDQVPLGVIASGYLLNDNDGLPVAADVAAYDTANIYKKALPYLDGQIVQSIPTLKFIPPYGGY